ncbi:two-component sensor histidine kinase [Kitasatospora sp. NE20-6]|uniref:sensor histidine kinase n=1 Tax=Kitasatospora sp. NE20-6 TaxID=2859066 RepID=UPI0034DB810F
MTGRPLTQRWRSFTRRRPLAADAVLLGFLSAVTATGSVYTTAHPGEAGYQVAGAVLATVGCLALLARRRHPTAVLATTAACTTAATLLGFLPTPLTLGPLMFALYWTALEDNRRTAFRWAAATTAAQVAAALLVAPTSDFLVLKTLNPAAWLMLMPLLGGNLRLRRAYVEAVEARAVEAERTREEEARHRVAEERIRIARELHDVVAHHLALANAQAGTAAYLARSHPDPRVQNVLDELSGTTASALRELKATVGVLRDADEDDSPLRPAPGVDDLPDLVRSFAVTGLHVDLTTTGAPVPLTSGVALTAYRIVQEALTNTAKHAATDTARVTLAYGPGHLTVTITDDGPTPPGDAGRPATAGEGPSGFGLIGMTERAQLIGGRLNAGPRRGGGFAVTAQLPLLPDDRPEMRP